MSTHNTPTTPGVHSVPDPDLVGSGDVEAVAKARGIDARDARAVMNNMAVVQVHGSEHEFRVYNHRGDCYEVDLEIHTCSCPDFEHNNPGRCKHIRRAALEAGDSAGFDRPEFIVDSLDAVDAIDGEIEKLMKERNALTAMLESFAALDAKGRGE